MTDRNGRDRHVDANSPDLNELLSRLTLEEKVLLLTGRDFWTTHPMPKIGLRSLRFSDGPSGVRGELWDERHPSLNLPSGTALGATWDAGLARRFGAVVAAEARRKDVDVVLGPTINLHRSPRGGRHFESYSEDPLLTGVLAAAFVEGVQSRGVGATPKHYVANDFETDRFTVDVAVPERALRELYLAPFEEAVEQAGPWVIMSAYNSVNGSMMTEHELLEAPLSTEWGFDGVVVSDWAAVKTVDSARFFQDLVMPGPMGPWGDALIAAVRDGNVAVDAVDRKVRRLLLLASRVGALGRPGAAGRGEAVVDDGAAFAREVEIAGAVLVRNDGTLPLHAPDLGSVAVIGAHAVRPRTQGGGSATVIPDRVVGPLEALRAALPGTRIRYAEGAAIHEGVTAFPLQTMTSPATGEPGALVRFLDADGGELHREDRRSAALVWFGGDAPVATAKRLEFSTTYTPARSGAVRIGFASAGNGRVFVDDRLRLEMDVAAGTPIGESFMQPPSGSVPVDVEAGVPVSVRIEYDMGMSETLIGAMSITVGIEPEQADPAALIAEAVAAARESDVAVVVVGTTEHVESEGHDRVSLALPGHQDELVAAVAAANPRTIVVVNSGAPVVMPWRDEVAAVLVSWFGGQEHGTAVADVLLGVAEPGGRLPTSWPAREEDVPVLDVTPVDGVVVYDEGIHIGYRAWLRAGVSPAFEFGHGLGYTLWRLDDATADAPDPARPDELTLTIPVTNIGARAGKQVVQVYASRPDSSVERPARWLVGFVSVEAAPGQAATAVVPLRAKAFRHWGVVDDVAGWVYEPGSYDLHIGTSVTQTPLAGVVRLTSDGALYSDN